MVKTAKRRSDHYDAKLQDDVWNYRITAEKPFMVEQVHIRYAQQFFNEQKVKDYLEQHDLYGIDIHHYNNYAQQVWALTRTFTGVTLRMEVEQAAAKWLRRNLNVTHLIRIAELFGVQLVPDAWSHDLHPP